MTSKGLVEEVKLWFYAQDGLEDHGSAASPSTGIMFAIALGMFYDRERQRTS